MKRRVVALSGHSHRQKGQQRQEPKSSILAGNRLRLMVTTLMGREWFPGGPYNQSRRGSIPRRSISFNIPNIYSLIKRSF
jgi:hypothetical protein